MLTWDLDDRLPQDRHRRQRVLPGRVDTPLGRLKDGGFGVILQARRCGRPCRSWEPTRRFGWRLVPEVEGISGARLFLRAQ